MIFYAQHPFICHFYYKRNLGSFCLRNNLLNGCNFSGGYPHLEPDMVLLLISLTLLHKYKASEDHPLPARHKFLNQTLVHLKVKDSLNIFELHIYVHL